jgi:hypothetical protein
LGARSRWQSKGARSRWPSPGSAATAGYGVTNSTAAAGVAVASGTSSKPLYAAERIFIRDVSFIWHSGKQQAVEFGGVKRKDGTVPGRDPWANSQVSQ